MQAQQSPLAGEIWTRLSAPIDPARIGWRQDGKPSQRQGKFYARFVAYIDANTVRERLDSVVAGEWDNTLDILPDTADAKGNPQRTVKARLAILGVVREDIGSGRDFKAAATDAFKRAATRFGIAHELADFGHNWVQVDGDSNFAKPVEDPGAAYARQQSGQPAAPQQYIPPATTVPDDSPAARPAGDSEVNCPKCGGKMWDNRIGKKNPKAPDFKCRDRSCDGVVWPPRPGSAPASVQQAAVDVLDLIAAADEDDLPF